MKSLSLFCIILCGTVFIYSAVIPSNLQVLRVEAGKTYYILARSGLVVRSEPSLTGKKIGLLEYNTNIKVKKITDETLVVSGIKNKWVEIKNNGKKGYVFSGFLSRYKGARNKIKGHMSWSKCFLELLAEALDGPLSNNYCKYTDDEQYSYRECEYPLSLGTLKVSSSDVDVQSSLQMSDMTLQEGFLILSSVSKSITPQTIQTGKKNSNSYTIALDNDSTKIQIDITYQDGKLYFNTP